MAKPTQIQGAPPVAACEALVELLKTKAKIISTWEQIKAVIKKIIKIIISIRYGYIDIIDLIGAELVAAIGAAATAMAQAALAAAAGAMAALLEAIFSAILEILLIFPDAVFSLVAIPLEKAQDAAAKERLYMDKARSDLDSIRNILSKWFKGIDGSRFYRQLKEALPKIQEALSLAAQMLSELDINGENAVFDEAKYDTLRADIKSAIQITKPKSILDTKTQFTKKITERAENQRKILVAEIEKTYKERKQALDLDYTNRIMANKVNIKIPTHDDLSGANELIAQFEGAINILTSIPSASQNLDEALNEEKIRLEWAARLKWMETEVESEIAKVELKINYQKTVSMSDVRSTGQDLITSFYNDMVGLKNYLTSFLENVKDAYIQHKLCQNYCNTVYNIRSLIKSMIKFMISLLRKVGNASSLLATGGLEAAEGMLNITNNMFQEEIEKYEDMTKSKDKNKRTGSMKMSATVVAGNALLESSDAVLTGLITESLIKLINSDDVLESGNIEFNAFTERLAKIPDWNGEFNIWAVDPFSSVSQNPYIQLIADASVMITKIPIASFSMKEDDKKEMTETITEVNNGFKTISDHNSYVLNVINSYTPYQCEAGGRLKKILENAGLLDAFAMGLSLISLLTELAQINNIKLSDLVPNVKNCTKFYKELFEDPNTAAAAETEDANRVPPSSLSDIQKKTEESEQAAIQAQSAEKYYSGMSDVKPDEIKLHYSTPGTTDRITEIASR